MSIPVLAQVYDEVRRLAIAGSVVAPGDFRMRKLLPALEQAGQKAPVFAKVAESAERLVESSENESAGALLNLSTLVSAILYTQGETGVDGPLQPLETVELGQQQTQASARTLKPLLEALTTTGSGRLEIIKDAEQRGLFRDLRLVRPALEAIDDIYGEIADFVAQRVLPLYGKAILHDLRQSFDPRGRGGHVRRLALIYRLDPDGSRDLVKQAIESGSKEVKIAAIECLGTAPEDLSFLLEQARAKSKDVRTAALKALGKSDTDDAVQALCAALQGSDVELSVAPIRVSRNPQLLTFVLEEARVQFEGLLADTEKDKAKVGKQVVRVIAVLECLRDRDDPQTSDFLNDAFAQRDKLATIQGTPSGKDARQRLVSIMASGPSKAQSVLVDAHATLPAEELSAAMVAACRSRKPGDVYEIFSPYLTTNVGKGKKRNSAYLKQQAVIQVLTSHWHWRSSETISDLPVDRTLTESLDKRWLDLAVEQQNLELVQALATPGHPGAEKLLSHAFEAQLKQSKSSYDLLSILQAMLRAQHPGATDAVIAAVSKTASKASTYGLYWIGHLIPELPRESIPKVEEWFSTLPENAVNQLLDYLHQWKTQK